MVKRKARGWQVLCSNQMGKSEQCIKEGCGLMEAGSWKERILVSQKTSDVGGWGGSGQEGNKNQ